MDVDAAGAKVGNTRDRRRLENLAIGVGGGAMLGWLAWQTAAPLAAHPSSGAGRAVPAPAAVGLESFVAPGQVVLMTVVVLVTLFTFWLAARTRRTHGSGASWLGLLAGVAPRDGAEVAGGAMDAPERASGHGPARDRSIS